MRTIIILLAVMISMTTMFVSGCVQTNQGTISDQKEASDTLNNVTEAINALPTPIVKETFPPSISIAKISRPNLSVPSKCSYDGANNIELLLNS